MNEKDQQHLDPSWLWAQQLATQRMISALAEGLGVGTEWKQQSTAKIEQLRDLLVSQQVSDAALRGLDDALAFLALIGAQRR